MLAGVLRDVLPTHACRQPPALLPAAPQANTQRTCSRTPPTPRSPSHAWRASLQEPSTLCCQEKATTFTKCHQRPGWVHTPPWCWQSHQGADCLGRQGGSHLLVLQGSQLAPAFRKVPESQCITQLGWEVGKVPLEALQRRARPGLCSKHLHRVTPS